MTMNKTWLQFLSKTCAWCIINMQYESDLNIQMLKTNRNLEGSMVTAYRLQ